MGRSPGSAGTTASSSKRSLDIAKHRRFGEMSTVMSTLGQKQTCAVHAAMSASPPKTDTCSARGSDTLVKSGHRKRKPTIRRLACDASAHVRYGPSGQTLVRCWIVSQFDF